MIIVLDSGPLGLLAHPKPMPSTLACRWWLAEVVGKHTVVVPEVIDYELRRELLRLEKKQSLERLDDLLNDLQSLSLTTAILRNAAQLWADTRRAGRPTATRDSLDIDVILAAQARSLQHLDEVVIATTNRKHLERFVRAEHWNEIR